MSVAEAAKSAGVSVATMRRWAASGRVTAWKVGKEWIVTSLESPPPSEVVRLQMKVDELRRQVARLARLRRLERIGAQGALDVLQWAGPFNETEHAAILFLKSGLAWHRVHVSGEEVALRVAKGLSYEDLELFIVAGEEPD
jgi:excisionase family DNA binding protein